jgi:hypothetical protein
MTKQVFLEVKNLTREKVEVAFTKKKLRFCRKQKA